MIHTSRLLWVKQAHCSLRIHTAGFCEIESTLFTDDPHSRILWVRKYTVHLESTQQAYVSEKAHCSLRIHTAGLCEWEIHCSLRIHTAGLCEWENTLFTEDPHRSPLLIRKHTVHWGSTQKPSMNEKAHCSLWIHTAGLCESEKKHTVHLRSSQQASESEHAYCSMRIHTAGLSEWEKHTVQEGSTQQAFVSEKHMFT